MRTKSAIVNSTPLISLSFIENLSLLDKLFKKVIIPSEVAKEVIQKGKPKSEEIKNWIEDKVVESLNKNWIELFSLSLDIGESEVLALYYEIPDSIVVIDEEKARKIAKRKKIPHIGTLGVLLLAKKMNLIDEIKPLLKELRERGIRISNELYSGILLAANESTK